MIRGLGCDIVRISRFSKGKEYIFHFMKKHLTTSEIKEIENRNRHKELAKFYTLVATKFSGKEAVAKALGSGFRNGITLRDIEILHDELGRPIVNLFNKALERAKVITDNQPYNIHITLSNEKEYTNAVAIIETN